MIFVELWQARAEVEESGGPGEETPDEFGGRFVNSAGPEERRRGRWIDGGRVAEDSAEHGNKQECFR